MAFGGGEPGPRTMFSWEQLEQGLNALAQEGWELHSITPSYNKSVGEATITYEPVYIFISRGEPAP
jgi:hypothetical protein